MYTNGNGYKPINLKIPVGTKDVFLQETRKRHTTMQAVLLAFVESYVEDPDRFRIRMEVK